MAITIGMRVSVQERNEESLVAFEAIQEEVLSQGLELHWTYNTGNTYSGLVHHYVVVESEIYQR